MTNLKEINKEIIDDINAFLDESGILDNPHAMPNISKRDWWKRKGKVEWFDLIMEGYNEMNEAWPIRVLDWINSRLNDEPLDWASSFDEWLELYATPTMLARYWDKEPANNRKSQLIVNGIRRYRAELPFEVYSAHEFKFCIDHNIQAKPKCKECGNDAPFGQCYNYGYRDFCSSKCQLAFNNKAKPPKRSDLNDDEIRDIISEIPLDVRSVSNESVMDHYLNMAEYSIQVKPSATPPETIHIFMNKLTLADVICPVCKTNYKPFVSQGAGYKKTCGGMCAWYRDGRTKHFSGASYTHGGFNSMEDGFIYILESSLLGSVKIGISIDPAKRLKTLRKNIADLEIVECIHVNGGLWELERKLHRKFKEYRQKYERKFDGCTEFFELNESQIDDAVQIIKDWKWNKQS